MATFTSLKMKIERLKMEIEYLEWMLDNEEFDFDTIQYIFINLKKLDIDKIIEDKKKQDEMTTYLMLQKEAFV